MSLPHKIGDHCMALTDEAMFVVGGRGPAFEEHNNTFVYTRESK